MLDNVLRALALVLFVVLSACDPAVTDVEHVEKAQEYIENGDLKSAAIELKNALQQNPQNPQARHLLGIVHFQVGDMAASEKELRRASEYGVADDAVQPMVAKALLAQSKYEELDALLLQKLASATSKAEVLSAQGLGKLSRGMIGEAQQQIEEAIKLAPDDPYTGVANMRLLMAKQEFDLAREEADRVIRVDPDYAPAWSALGVLQHSQNQLDEAEISYSKAIEIRVFNDADLLRRATLRIQLGNYEKAQEDVDVLLKRVPSNSGVNFAQGLIELHNIKLEKARESFERALKVNERQFAPIYYLALANLQLGNIEQADDFGERAFAIMPNAIKLRELLAAIKIEKRNYTQAEDLVRPIVRAREDNIRAKDLLASALIGQQKAELAVPLLKIVLSSQPESAAAEMRLGIALLSAGESQEGIEHIRKSIDKDPQLHLARLALVGEYVRLNDLDSAMQVAEDFRDYQSDDPAPWNLIGRLYLKQNRERNAIQAFNRAKELDPGNSMANHQLAVVAAKENDLPKARGFYEDILAQDKSDSDALHRLAILDAVENKEAEMIGHLKQAISVDSRALGPRVMLARHFLSRGEADKVAPLMVELSQQDKDSPMVLEVIAYSQLAQGQFADAGHTLKRLIEARPEEAEPHFLMAKAHAGLKDESAMRLELQRVLEYAPQHMGAHLALARLANLRNQDEPMREHLLALEDIAPDDPEVIRLKAELANKEGAPDRAAVMFESLFEAVPTTETMLSVASQKWKMGNLEEAVRLQEEWLGEHHGDVRAALSLARTYSHLDDREKMVSLYEKVLQSDGSELIALNELAWHLREEQPQKALVYAQRASELSPNSPVVLDTLALVQMSNGQFELAKRSIERALQKAPANLSIRYHSAVIAEASGDSWEASNILSELLEDAAVFPERKEAEEMLQRLRPN